MRNYFAKLRTIAFSAITHRVGPLVSPNPSDLDQSPRELAEHIRCYGVLLRCRGMCMSERGSQDNRRLGVCGARIVSASRGGPDTGQRKNNAVVAICVQRQEYVPALGTAEARIERSILYFLL